MMTGTTVMMMKILLMIMMMMMIIMITVYSPYHTVNIQLYALHPNTIICQSFQPKTPQIVIPPLLATSNRHTKIFIS